MRSTFVAIAAAIAVAAGISAGGLGHADAQNASSASVDVRLNVSVEGGSALRIVNRGMEICTEIPLRKESSEYRADVSSSATCKLTAGEDLGFWLVHANGGIEPLVPDNGASVAWNPGAELNVVLKPVPCADPCAPPHVAGPSDLAAPPHTSGASELPQALPGTGSGAGQARSLNWLAGASAGLLLAGLVLFGLPIMHRRR